MKKPIIEIKNIAKKYKIGVRQPYYSLRDSLMDLVSYPLKIFHSSEKKTDSLTKDEFWALNNISLNIMPGEIIGIIGKNGAGKTTLLKILSRITPPTKGEIILRGRVASLLEVGTGFHPELTGRENIYLNGAILGMKQWEIKKKFDEIVHFAEIEKFLDTPVKHYSSGMYMRLAFSVAAHLEPEILLVDEVLAVGDIEFQKKCLGKMHDVVKEGRTILFVSHNMMTISHLCNKSIMLRFGSIIKEGLTKDVVADYLKDIFNNQPIKEWKDIDKAPGTKELKLLSVKLTKNDNRVARIVYIDDILRIQLTYYVGMPKLKFRCAVSFNTKNICAFISIEPVEKIREKIGIYHSTVIVPNNLLAEGEYTLTISMFSSKGVKQRYILEPDIINFQVVESSSGSLIRGDYTGHFDGVVRPLLIWKTS